MTIDNCTFKNNYAYLSGGIQLFNANITFMGDVIFANNSGFSAGAIYMSGSYLRFTDSLNLTFIGNSADFVGGAITVKESFNFYTNEFARIITDPRPRCFYQLLFDTADPKNLTAQLSVAFVNNTANIAGDNIYGSNPIIVFCFFEPEKSLRL